jgi:hypothetical protein
LSVVEAVVGLSAVVVPQAGVVSKSKTSNTDEKM